MILKNGPIYTEVLDLLCEAHKECLKANQGPDGDALGMSHGAFSGMNKALGLVWQLENDLVEAEMKIRILEQRSKPAPMDF